MEPGLLLSKGGVRPLARGCPASPRSHILPPAPAWSPANFGLWAAGSGSPCTAASGPWAGHVLDPCRHPRVSGVRSHPNVAPFGVKVAWATKPVTAPHASSCRLMVCALDQPQAGMGPGGSTGDKVLCRELQRGPGGCPQRREGGRAPGAGGRAAGSPRERPLFLWGLNAATLLVCTWGPPRASLLVVPVLSRSVHAILSPADPPWGGLESARGRCPELGGASPPRARFPTLVPGPGAEGSIQVVLTTC